MIYLTLNSHSSGILRGLVHQKGEQADRFISNAITERLFMSKEKEEKAECLREKKDAGWESTEGAPSKFHQKEAAANMQVLPTHIGTPMTKKGTPMTIKKGHR